MSRPVIAYTGLLMKGGRLLTRWLPMDTRVRQLQRAQIIPRRTEWV
jgi:hypothetical protein